MATAAVAALVFAANGATAATYDVNLQGVTAAQDQVGDTTQRALALSAAVGDTGNNVDVSATGASIAQNMNVASNIGQDVGGTINGNGQLIEATQNLDGAVDQASAALAGTGDLGAGSSISSVAANMGQNLSIDVRVRQ